MGPLFLPDSKGHISPYQPRESRPELTLEPDIPPVRAAYAAAHVVANPVFDAENEGRITPDAIDWEATLAYREHLWSLGLSVAEAMDTAQRGTELNWDLASALLDLTLAKARGRPERRVIGGAGADSVADPLTCSLNDVIDAYLTQVQFIQERGGEAILFPTPILPERFPKADHYREVIGTVAENISEPVYIHWLGRQFDSRIGRYWGYDDILQAATEVLLPLMAEHADKIKGIKLSLLDPPFEEWLRRRLMAQGQVVLTGDDLNFAELLKGYGPVDAPVSTWSAGGTEFSLGDFSHALLGVFDGVAPVAAKALQHLAKGDVDSYDRLMRPAVELSRHIFATPMPYYKVGLVFLAYLNGHQNHFRMVGGIEGHRSLPHLVTLFKLAEQAGVLEDVQEAYERFRPLLRLGGCNV